jgi:hypothetical protein
MNAESAESAEGGWRTYSLYVLCALCVPFFLSVSACGGGQGGSDFFKQYEYEEDMYLSLDGSAALYVNTSIAALNALRGTSFDATPNGRTDREVFRAYFTTPRTHVTRASPFRRSGRRFVSVRMDVEDIRTLGETPPFAWSKYTFTRDGDVFVYTQTVGAAAGRDPGAVGWTGRELAAFRMHVPSRIRFHNTKADVGRGNILTWEQLLTDRMRGVPLSLEARMDARSILYRTLILFGSMAALVAIGFVLVIVWVRRKA